MILSSPSPRGDRVVALAAVEAVVAGAAVEGVVAGAEVGVVVVRPGGAALVARLAEDEVVARARVEVVGAAAADQAVVAVPALDAVAVAVAAQLVVASEAEDLVGAAAALDGVRPLGAREDRETRLHRHVERPVGGQVDRRQPAEGERGDHREASTGPRDVEPHPVRRPRGRARAAAGAGAREHLAPGEVDDGRAAPPARELAARADDRALAVGLGGDAAAAGTGAERHAAGHARDVRVDGDHAAARRRRRPRRALAALLAAALGRRVDGGRHPRRPGGVERHAGGVGDLQVADRSAAQRDHRDAVVAEDGHRAAAVGCHRERARARAQRDRAAGGERHRVEHPHGPARPGVDRVAARRHRERTDRAGQPDGGDRRARGEVDPDHVAVGPDVGAPAVRRGGHGLGRARHRQGPDDLPGVDVDERGVGAAGGHDGDPGLGRGGGREGGQEENDRKRSAHGSLQPGGRPRVSAYRTATLLMGPFVHRRRARAGAPGA